MITQRPIIVIKCNDVTYGTQLDASAASYSVALWDSDGCHGNAAMTDNPTCTFWGIQHVYQEVVATQS